MKTKRKFLAIGIIAILLLIIVVVGIYILLPKDNRYYFSRYSGITPSYTETMDSGTVNEYYPDSIDWFEIVAYMDWLEGQGFDQEFLGINGMDYKMENDNGDTIFILEHAIMYSGYMSIQYQINMEED